MSLEQLKSTGNPDIDGTHKLIIELLEEVLSNIKNNSLKDVPFQIKNLLWIASQHFKDEEQLMREIDYPFRESHFLAHNNITLKLMHLLELFDKPPTKIKWLLNTIEHNIISHVEQFDVALFRYNTLILNNARLV